MNKPSNMKELKTFLGFIQYLAKFLPNMVDVSAPLRKLLEKNTVWHWEKQQENSFQPRTQENGKQCPGAKLL